MKIRIRANENLLHDELGPIQKGAELTIDKIQLSGIRRFVEVLNDAPIKAPGLKPSASPAGQASRKKTVTRSKRGARKQKQDE